MPISDLADQTIMAFLFPNAIKPIGGTSDRLLRLLVVHDKRVQNYDSAEQFSKIDETGKPLVLSFSNEGSSWHPTAA